MHFYLIQWVFWMTGWAPTGRLTLPQPPSLKGRRGSSAGRMPRTQGGSVASWPPCQGRPCTVKKEAVLDIRLSREKTTSQSASSLRAFHPGISRPRTAPGLQRKCKEWGLGGERCDYGYISEKITMVMIWKTDMSWRDLASKGQNWHNQRGRTGEIKRERRDRDQHLHVSKGHALLCAFSAVASFSQPREGKSQHAS